MHFEQAVQLVHSLSEKLAKYAELQGDFAMEAEYSISWKAIKKEMSDLRPQIEQTIEELEQGGTEKIFEVLEADLG